MLLPVERMGSNRIHHKRVCHHFCHFDLMSCHSTHSFENVALLAHKDSQLANRGPCFLMLISLFHSLSRLFVSNTYTTLRLSRSYLFKISFNIVLIFYNKHSIQFTQSTFFIHIIWDSLNLSVEYAFEVRRALYCILMSDNNRVALSAGSRWASELVSNYTILSSAVYGDIHSLHAHFVIRCHQQVYTRAMYLN